MRRTLTPGTYFFVVAKFFFDLILLHIFFYRHPKFKTTWGKPYFEGG